MIRNPPLRIVVDRAPTVEAKGGLVGKFSDPVTLFRVMDGEELAIAHASGVIEGGMFATQSERRYGASWAASSMQEVADWGRYWSRAKRLGQDLFVAVAEGRGRVFYHMTAGRKVRFDPEGAEQQGALLDSELCSTGLGCSMAIGVKDVSFFAVEPGGTLSPISEREIQDYLDEHPLPDVLLLPLGGTNWFGGVILGRSVAVGQDPQDKLWLVRNRAGRPFVIGAKTKKAAIDEAFEVIASMAEQKVIVRLNRVPAGFDAVREGQIWTSADRGPMSITELGASYVGGVGATRWGDKMHWIIKAPELMKRWERVD